MGVQLFLFIFQSDRQIGGPPRAPEEIEIIPDPLTLVEFGHRAEQSILSLEPDRRVLDGSGLTRRRGAGEFTTFAGGLDRLVGIVRFFLAGGLFGQEVELRFAELKVSI